MRSIVCTLVGVALLLGNVVVAHSVKFKLTPMRHVHEVSVEMADGYKLEDLKTMGVDLVELDSAPSRYVLLKGEIASRYVSSLDRAYVKRYLNEVLEVYEENSQVVRGNMEQEIKNDPEYFTEVYEYDCGYLKVVLVNIRFDEYNKDPDRNGYIGRTFFEVIMPDVDLSERPRMHSSNPYADIKVFKNGKGEVFLHVIRSVSDGGRIYKVTGLEMTEVAWVDIYYEVD